MRRIIIVVISFVALIIYSLPAYAESYQGIGPFDTLGDVKAKYPGAKYVRDNPAWAKETEVLYIINGSGLVGQIIINFADHRTLHQKLATESKDPAIQEWQTTLANQTDDEALMVQWVRWVPDNPISLDRVTSKYGIPDKKDFTDEMMPIRLWNNRGLLALLTDDEKRVIFIQFNFTKEDMRKAWMARYGYIPDHLKKNDPPKRNRK